MGTAKRYGKFNLTETEIEQLTRITNTRTEEAQKVQRAKILLLSIGGMNNLDIARKLDLHRNSVTLSSDEKPGIQAMGNVAEDLPPTADHGFVGRDSEYRQLGTVSLLVGMDLGSGEIIPLVRETHKSVDFIDFLKILDGKYAKDRKIRIVLDNHSAHTSRETRGYLAEHPGRFKFVFTPKHGSWLNMIESFFDKFARVCLKGIKVNSKEELVRQIYQYMDEVNAEPVVYL